MSLLVHNELENLIIGGDFNTNPWQRGASFVSPATTDYTADRFQIRKSGAQEFTITQDTDSPSHADSGLFNTQCMKTVVTTPNVGPGATEFTTIEQPIEGYMAMPIYQNSFSIGFWVFSSVAGTYCVTFQNNARDRNYISEYTIVSPNTWERFEFLIVHDGVGTWEIGNLAGLRAIFTLDAGSTFQGSSDTWQGGDLIATSNQVNFSASGGNDFRIALIRCIKDSVADTYWMRDRMTQLALCQRYYQKSYNVDVDPGTVTPSGVAGTTTTGSAVLTGLDTTLLGSMRATPTIEWYSSATGTIDNVANITDVADVPITSTTGTGENNTGYPIATASVNANKVLEGHYTMEAEL